MKLYCVDEIYWLEPHGHDFDFPEDVRAIVNALASSGYEVDPRHAKAAWSKMSSEDYCTGWMIVKGSDDASIVQMIMPHLKGGEHDDGVR